MGENEWSASSICSIYVILPWVSNHQPQFHLSWLIVVAEDSHIWRPLVNMNTDWMAMRPRLHIMCFSDDLWSCLLWEFFPAWSYRPSHFIWWAVFTHRPFPFPHLLLFPLSPFNRICSFLWFFFTFLRQTAKAFSSSKVNSRSCFTWVSGGITFHCHSPSLKPVYFPCPSYSLSTFLPWGSFCCCFVLKCNLDSQV